MGEGKAWVTLATNDSYSLGALVLAHSLHRANTAHPVVILVTPGVTPIMRERLTHVFAEVISVDVLDSGDAAHLALLSRPELGITFTKLHCWTLTQYSKCVFLDADTLVLQNCDELFEKDELSAAPDVGWPDCFNSGVFVYRPSNETFTSLVEFAKENGSFDGGDQGLLNQYFSSWATGDISKHLSFLYNVCSTSFYSYLPALKQYGQNMKIVHFIGQVKPWLENFNWGSRSVGGSGTLQGPLQFWWDIFIDQVHPVLDVAMGSNILEAESPSLYTPPNPPLFPWHRPITPPPTPDHHQDTLQNDFVDPWELYAPQQQQQHSNEHNHFQPPHESSNQTYNHAFETPHNVEQHFYEEPSNNHSTDAHMNEEVMRNIYIPKAWYECRTNEDEQQSETQTVVVNDLTYQDEISTCYPGGSNCGTEYTETYSQNDDTFNVDNELFYDAYKEQEHDDDVEMMTKEDDDIDVRPRHPYDNFYILHRVVMDTEGHKRCIHEAPPVVPEPPQTPSPSPPPTPEENTQAGVAGALSQLAIGSTDTSPAMDEHLRRQGWEAGNIDYMGADAFDNIWAKITQTLSIAAAPSEPEPTPEVIAAPQPPVPVSEVRPSAPQVIPSPTPVIPAPVDVAKVSLPESRASTESFEQIVSGVTATVSDISISKPSSLDNSSDSSFAAAPPTPPPAEKKVSTESTKEGADNKQDQAVATQQPELPTKPMERLVCHLKPAIESDPLLTPESELEDAATIAQKIIASEEALSSPIITSATPMTSPPICPIASQNIKDLIVETAIPDTPPLSGPVSLAQIGIIPSKTDEQESVTQEPKTLVQLTESKVDTVQAALPQEPEKPQEELKTEVAPKCEIVKKVSEETQPKVLEEASKSEAPVEHKKAAETKIPEKTPKQEAVKEPQPKLIETKKSDIVESQTNAPEQKPVKEADVPKTPTESKSLEQPPPAAEKTTEESKTKKTKKIVKQKSSTESGPKTPEAEKENKQLVCSLKTKDDPPKTVAEIVLPKDLENVKLPKALEKAILEPTTEKVETKASKTEKESEAKKVDSTPAEVVSKGDLPSAKEEPAAGTKVVKKVKKVVKKVPGAPKAETAGSEADTESVETPVPPPRKKVVKPKEK